MHSKKSSFISSLPKDSFFPMPQESLDLEHCVVVFSGGQDSSVVACWAKKIFKKVSLLSFDYSQKHSIELKCAKEIASILNLELKILKIDCLFSLTVSALLNCSKEMFSLSDSHSLKENLPASFVPNRNALFITLAHTFAQTLRANNVALGVSEEDYSGYPDCRMEFIQSLQKSLNLGSDSTITLHTPLISMKKSQEFRLALDLGVLDLILENTHTCYEGKRERRFEWGWGCGECIACKLRKRGFEEFSAGFMYNQGFDFQAKESV